MFGTHTYGIVLGRLRDEMERLFSDFVEGSPLFDVSALVGARAFPALNIWESDNNLYVEAEMPGLNMDNIEVLVKGQELTIKGERKDTGEADRAYHRRERGVGSFSRIVRLPVEIDSQNVQASLKDGILTVTLPKGEFSKPRRIEVKTSTK